jgi:PIN domain nuclease of toxin-antitoxin system
MKILFATTSFLIKLFSENFFKMIKSVIFDVGGTYLKGSINDFVNNAYKILGINSKFYVKEEVVFDSDFNIAFSVLYNNILLTLLSIGDKFCLANSCTVLKFSVLCCILYWIGATTLILILSLDFD